MKKKTLYVTDLDGTLLGGDSRISNASAEMLTRLADAGVMFTAATDLLYYTDGAAFDAECRAVGLYRQ